MEVPIPETLVAIHEGTISTTEEMSDFGEGAVVSPGQYFWSRKEKGVVKKGSKRSREGTFKQGSIPNQIIWKTDSSNTKKEALDTTSAMGDFVRANFDLVSQLNKSSNKRRKNCKGPSKT